MEMTPDNNPKVNEAVPMSSATIPQLSRFERIETLKLTLPESHTPYNDKYFLRSGEILKATGVNPFVRAQVVIRSSEGPVYGLDEALAIIDRYSNLTKNGGRVYALPEGANCPRNTALMVIEGRIQDIIELETMYLGVIARATTAANDGVAHVDLEQVTKKTKAITELIGDRPLMYFGARHWSFREDAVISHAAFNGGASQASTDIGAATFGSQGVGTTPHIIENIMAWKYGRENAVKMATVLFNQIIDPKVPRIALINYRNHEVDDAVATAQALGDRLYAVRIDTCGENIAQGAVATRADIPANSPLKAVEARIPATDEKYWFGHGVTVSGVVAVRQALDKAGFKDVKIVLTSGFADAEKVKAFLRAEQILGLRLFDSLGVGGLFKPCRSTKTDVVAVADSRDDLDSSPVSKAGRTYRPNPDLELALGA